MTAQNSLKTLNDFANILIVCDLLNSYFE